MYPDVYAEDFQVGQLAQGAGETPADGATSADEPSEVEQAAAVGAQGQGAFWWIGAAVLLVVFMILTDRFTPETPFSQLKPSIYNIVVIGIASVLFGALAKVAATKWKVKGLSAVILSS